MMEAGGPSAEYRASTNVSDVVVADSTVKLRSPRGPELIIQASPMGALVLRVTAESLPMARLGSSGAKPKPVRVTTQPPYRDPRAGDTPPEETPKPYLV